MNKITKAVFPVAGMGTRFLPATKASAKEMMPVVDKPLIQYAVEEAVAAGMTEMIFITGRGKRAIEDHLRRALGYPVVTFLRTVPELAAIAAHAPFPQEQFDRGGTLYVALMKTAPGPSVRRAVAALRTDLDDFTIEGRELYWLRRSNLMQSIAAGPSIEKVVGSPMTVRNVNTMRRLALKYCG